MKMKRIVAKDMREALKIMKETLGDNAMILTTQKIKEGVEIMAGLDEADISQKFNEKIIQRDSENIKRTNSIFDPSLDALRDELYALRHVVQEELGHFAFQDVSNKHPVQSLVFEHLIQIGIEKELAKELAFEVKERNSLTKALVEAMNIVLYRLNELGNTYPENINCFVFSGLSGVGKTSSLAAFALSHRLNDPKKKIRFINFDHDKVAANEPLQTYSKILNAEYFICHNESELKKLSEDPEILTLIDASIERKEIINFVKNNQNSMRVLVISAVMDYSSQIKIKGFFDQNMPVLAVVTHTDEADALGMASSILLKWKLIPLFTLKHEKNPHRKKAVFFDSRIWVDDLFKNSFSKISENKFKKGAA